MADDATRALAFVARRQGRTAMPAAEWALVLSLDLGWMPPAKATAFVARALAAGLLDEEPGPAPVLRLRPDPALVDVPAGFRPDPDATPAPVRDDPFVAWLGRLAAGRPEGTTEALAEVERRQARLDGLLDALPAILWAAAERGLDVRDAARQYLASLRPGGPAAPAAAARP